MAVPSMDWTNVVVEKWQMAETKMVPRPAVMIVGGEFDVDNICGDQLGPLLQ